MEEVYHAVYTAAPNACLLTIVPRSDCTVSQPSAVATLSVTQLCTSQSVNTAPVLSPSVTLVQLVEICVSSLLPVTQSTETPIVASLPVT